MMCIYLEVKHGKYETDVVYNSLINVSSLVLQ